MKKHLSKKRIVLAAIVTVALALASGVAYAYWTSGGTGTGSAVATTPVGTITVNQTTVVTGLYPGATAVALSGNFNNSNTGAAHIASITAAVTSITNGGVGLPVCTTGDFVIGGSFAPAGGLDIPAGNNQGAWSGLTVQLQNTAANQDSCKGATANITYTVH